MDGVGQLAELNAVLGQLALADEFPGGEDEQPLLVRVGGDDGVRQLLRERGVVALQPSFIRLIVEMHAVNVRLADEAE